LAADSSDSIEREDGGPEEQELQERLLDDGLPHVPWLVSLRRRIGDRLGLHLAVWWRAGWWVGRGPRIDQTHVALGDGNREPFGVEAAFDLAGDEPVGLPVVVGLDPRPHHERERRLTYFVKAHDGGRVLQYGWMGLDELVQDAFGALEVLTVTDREREIDAAGGLMRVIADYLAPYLLVRDDQHLIVERQYR